MIDLDEDGEKDQGERLRRLVNASGFVLQLAIEAAVEDERGRSGWSVYAREYPWTKGRREGGFMSLGRHVIRPAAAALGAGGILISTVNNIAIVHDQLETNFWRVLAVSWLLALAALWPQPARRPKEIGFRSRVPVDRLVVRDVARRYAGPVVITILMAGAAGWRWYRQWHPTPLPAGESVIDPTTPIPVQSSPTSLFRLSARPLYAQLSVPAQQPKIVSFELSSTKTSYVEQQVTPLYIFRHDLVDIPDSERLHGVTMSQWMSAARAQGVLPPHAVMRRFQFPTRCPEDTFNCTAYAHRCESFENDARILPALRRFVTARGRRERLSLLSSYDVLTNAVHRRAAALRDIVPRGEEWNSITDAADRDIILRWTKNCIGIPYPVFVIAIENPTDRAIVVTGLRYIVLYWDAAAGGMPTEGPSGPVVPAASYAHALEVGYNGRLDEEVPYRAVMPLLDSILPRTPQSIEDENPQFVFPVARQRRALRPPLQVAPGGVVSFEVQLYPTSDGEPLVDAPLTWWMLTIEVITSGGDVRVPEFMLDFATPAVG